MSKQVIEIMGLGLNTVSVVCIEGKRMISMPIAPKELIKGLETILDELGIENVEVKLEVNEL